jgi:hypothetical protein
MGRSDPTSIATIRATGGGAGARAEAQMQGGGGRTVVAAAIAAVVSVPLVALVVVGALGYVDASDEADDAARPGLADTLGPAVDVAVSLATERAHQGIRAMGFEDAVEGPGPESVEQTDRAIAALRAAGGLGASTDVLAELPELRTAADAAFSESVVATGEAVTDGYARVIAAFGDDVEAAIRELDGADGTRSGAIVAWEAYALRPAAADLVQRTITTTIVTVQSPEQISALVAAAGEVRSGVAALAEAPAPYDRIVALGSPDAAVADVLAQADAVMAGAQVSPGVLLDMAAAPELIGLDEIGSGVIELHDQVQDDRRDAADDRARTGVLLAAGGVAGLLVLVVFVVGVAVGSGRRRRPPADGLGPVAPVTLPPPPGVGAGRR